MIRTAVFAGMAIGIGLGGAATAQSLHMPPIPQAIRALLVDHDNDKHRHGKNKHREQEDDNEDDDRGRNRGSFLPGAWREYPPPPTYYYSPQPFSYATPYAPYAPYQPVAPAQPSASARPSARVPSAPTASGSAATEPSRRSGSTAPTIQWVDPPPAR